MSKESLSLEGLHFLIYQNYNIISYMLDNFINNNVFKFKVNRKNILIKTLSNQLKKSQHFTP